MTWHPAPGETGVPPALRLHRSAGDVAGTEYVPSSSLCSGISYTATSCRESPADPVLSDVPLEVPQIPQGIEMAQAV